MGKISLKINGIPVQVEQGTTLLEAARQVSVNIPVLCYHPDLPSWGACSICVVKVKGSTKLIRACATAAGDGMEVITHDPEIYNVRRTVIELILSTHPNDCLQCARNQNCELQTLAAEFGIRDVPWQQRLRADTRDESTPAIILNPEKCILCGRCARVDQQMQNVWALEFCGRGENMIIKPAFGVQLDDSPCMKCGQCAAHCPVGAIYEHSDSKKVYEALSDPTKYPVVQIAPAVRVAIGEAFGYPPGALLTGKTYAALRRLGFKAIFDTNFSADLTIMEEAQEFAERFLHGKGSLPLITSCCPAWTDYMEKFDPDFLENFSTAKSPQEMMGVMAKTYYAQKMGLDPSRIYMVSIMPCTAKKYEITRSDDMFASGFQDIDVSLTTRELSRMIKSAGIDFASLPDEAPDSLLAEYTGAGTIFGVSGGVMEAALRTAYFLITGQELPQVVFQPVRGLASIKEAEVVIAGKTVRVAVANEMCHIETVLNRVRECRARGQEPCYHFIEVMACRGGCIGGGGQPYNVNDQVRAQRAAGLYTDDDRKQLRCSHQNPAIQKLYAEFLEKPLSAKAERYLHNHYKVKPKYRNLMSAATGAGYSGV